MAAGKQNDRALPRAGCDNLVDKPRKLGMVIALKRAIESAAVVGGQVVPAQRQIGQGDLFTIE